MEKMGVSKALCASSESCQRVQGETANEQTQKVKGGRAARAF